MADFLLEIRTEEIPANALASAREQLAAGVERVLAEAGFSGASVRALSTNRRLAVKVRYLPARQEDRREEVTGPPRSAAFTADGAPTKAAEGFARKVGVPVEDLRLVETDRGEYVAATVLLNGRTTRDLLADALPGVVTGLHFPKMMRWGTGEHSFVRPVHGLVAVLDGEVVPLTLFGHRATHATVGHRVHAPEAFIIQEPSAYEDMLAERTVLVEPAVRLHILEQRARELAAEVDCKVHPDPRLVAEHVELAEYPRLLLGSFDPAFLELPREVVITTLRHHQKCLVLERSDGGLAPYFLTVIDRADDPKGLIRQGNEWVIGARLADARFFFSEDRKHTLDELVPGLDRLDFHRKLGSLGDKARRVGELAVYLAAAAGSDESADELRRLSALVKADLVTHMVGEFPELQGVMGGHYLRLAGEPSEVWTAARDHYRPQGFDGALPESGLGRLVGAADRLDTVVGLFAVGEVPSGSRDPFGLRRAAQGLVKIVMESGWEVDLRAAAARALELAGEAVAGELEAVTTLVDTFLSERVRRYLVEMEGLSGDTVDAVLEAGWTNLPELAARGRALEAVRAEPQFRSLALAFKRVRNITEGQPDANVNPELLSEQAERELAATARAFHDDLGTLLPERRLGDAFTAMGTLAEVLDRFFVEVLVMAEDEGVRSNRIALLKGLRRDFLTLADLSKLQVEGADQ